MPSRELVATIEDLRWLREVLADGWERSDSDARRMSVILRRLLVEDEVGRSWRELGFAREPTVRAVCLRKLVSGHSYRAVGVAIAGAATLDGCRGMGSFIPGVGGPSFGVVERAKRQLGSVEDQAVTAWLRSPGILTRGTFIERRVIVKYVANRLGGVHFGEKKSKDDPFFRVLENMPVGHNLFGSSPETLKQPVFAELIAIGQTLAFSASAYQMAESARSADG